MKPKEVLQEQQVIKAIASAGKNTAAEGKSTSGQTIDLQGVAAFLSLVELLAQELGVTPGRIQGQLPQGPNAFEELVGEITVNNQGYQRTLILKTRPGSHLKMHFNVAWSESPKPGAEEAVSSGIDAHFDFNASVEQILPQARAMARYVEDCFKLMDSMVTLGQAGKLATMQISASQIEAFELSQSSDLVLKS